MATITISSVQYHHRCNDRTSRWHNNFDDWSTWRHHNLNDRSGSWCYYNDRRWRRWHLSHDNTSSIHSDKMFEMNFAHFKVSSDIEGCYMMRIFAMIEVSDVLAIHVERIMTLVAFNL
ncbi:unnamed protein product [Haemonchus placei]|uniref:Kringle domain-containing protein n=1 Tax=Haemonchus placei TaxID=6290 RepID=A0A0N4WBG1_HAEPC|nr:unnamed protein product [Haemonchus placei]